MSDSLRKKNIDGAKLAAEIQKAKFQGKPISEVIKNLKPEQVEKKNLVADANEIKQGEVIKQNFLQKAKSFATSVASKGINGAKASEQTYSLRVLSCHGKGEDNLPPCPHRKDSSKYPGSHFCGACGCGDKQMTQLSPFVTDGKQSNYIKLNYPKVSCPLEMPGFTNYKSCLDSEKTSNDRKKFIEFKHGVDYIRENSSNSNPKKE